MSTPNSQRVLLDSSTLIAIAITEHEHHAAALGWLGDTLFATCPITQGALVRAVVRSPRGTAESALELVREISALDEHEFWSDELTFADVSLDGVIGHRQVTDAYLAQLARHKDGRIATLDRAMAAVHSDVAELVPT